MRAEIGPTVHELVRWYVREHVELRRPSSRRTLSWICRWWAGVLPDYPLAADVHTALSSRVRRGELSASTANMRRRVLNRCYEVGRTRWPLLTNVAHGSGVAKIPEPAKTVRGLLQPLETYPRLLDVLPGPEGKLVAALCRRAGLRIGEVRGLEPSDVLWQSEEVYVRQQRELGTSRPGQLKTDTCSARLPMHPEVAELMRETLAARMRRAPHGTLARFLLPITKETQESLLRRMRDVAPLDFPSRVLGESGAAGWHVLRHTYGTELVDAGLPIHEVQLAMRHAALSSTQNYIAAIRGRRVPTASLRALWESQAERLSSSDVIHDSPRVPRLPTPKRRKDMANE